MLADPNPDRLLPHQRPPDDPAWSTFVLLGGRGSGKTFAGASWLASIAAAAPHARLALVGPTLHDVREVMIEGRSGLVALPRYADGPKPTYEPSRRRLRFPGGATAHALSAEDPESLRGPQFHAAWVDELCAWRRPAETLALLRMGLRLGDDPRLFVTTTPKPLPALRRLLAEPGCANLRAPTVLNAENLAPPFLERLHALYGGTRLAAQELDGLIVEDAAAALWTPRRSPAAGAPGPRCWTAWWSPSTRRPRPAATRAASSSPAAASAPPTSSPTAPRPA